MSREHKYRAWDKEFQRMSLPIEPFKNGQLFFFFPGIGTRAGNHEQLIIEEFTGKRDSKGQEIYRNDLVKDEVAGIGKDTVVWNEQELSWWLLETNVSLGSLIFSKVQHYDPKTGQPYWTDLEVIGHIHQPEGEQI